MNYTALKTLLERVDITPNGCYEYNMFTHKGYGKFWFEGSLHQAHRAAYLLCNGDIPEGYIVMHKCDNPPCCNPKHLKLGSQAQNVQDMIDKGRANFESRIPTRGELSGLALLKEKEVREIKVLLSENRLTHKEIGQIYGVSRQAITNISTGLRWAHVN